MFALSLTSDRGPCHLHAVIESPSTATSSTTLAKLRLTDIKEMFVQIRDQVCLIALPAP